jgi:Glu-tRNA(Gln) amidotransferase subunit E-like FAD-binding protein
LLNYSFLFQIPKIIQLEKTEAEIKQRQRQLMGISQSVEEKEEAEKEKYVYDRTKVYWDENGNLVYDGVYVY